MNEDKEWLVTFVEVSKERHLRQPLLPRFLRSMKAAWRAGLMAAKYGGDARTAAAWGRRAALEVWEGRAFYTDYL